MKKQSSRTRAPLQLRTETICRLRANGLELARGGAATVTSSCANVNTCPRVYSDGATCKD